MLSHRDFDLDRRQCLKTMAAAIAMPFIAAPAMAQEWKPTKTIRFIVGFAAGGSADVLARLLQTPMSQRLGVPVVVENITGAGANIAMAAVARSAPDGHTIGMGSVGTHAINPALYGDKLQFRVPDDFTPITLLVQQPNVLIINKNIPAKNAAEFIAWIRANPGQNFGSAGIGTSNHLSGELFALRFGAKLAHVAYRGANQVLTDVIAGHIPMTFDNITTAAQLAADGQVRAIAVTPAKRSPKLPDVPTVAEAGAPGYDLTSWQGLFGPKGLSPDMTARLYDAVQFALNEASVKQKLADFGSEIGGQKPNEFAAFVAAEKMKWGNIVREANVKID